MHTPVQEDLTHITQGGASMTALTKDEFITVGKANTLEGSLLQADEPSHIHIPRPSRVMRLTVGTVDRGWADPREPAYAGGIGES